MRSQVTSRRNTFIFLCFLEITLELEYLPKFLVLVSIYEGKGEAGFKHLYTHPPSHTFLANTK